MNRTSIAVAASAAATLVLSSAANAQTPGEVILEIDQPVLAPGESTTVRLWAGYDGDADFAMCCVLTDVLADSGGLDLDAAWSDAALIPPMD